METLKSLTFRALRSALAMAGIRSTFRYASKDKAFENCVAAKSSYGFWYIGDIFDTHDSAYGILQNGFVEETESKVFIALFQALQKDGSIAAYDLGAHTGYYSMLAAKTAADAGREASIVAFEPLPKYAKTIKETAYLNRFENAIKVIEIGVSDGTASKDFYVSGSGSSLDKRVPEHASEVITVKTATLDGMIRERALPTPSILKIDIEGHELEAIKGMKSLIADHKPVLFREIIKSTGSFTNQRFQETFDRLKALGYDAYVTVDDDATLGIHIKKMTAGNPEAKKTIDMYTFIPAGRDDIAELANATLKRSA